MRNHEALVILLGGQGFEGALLGIRDGNDAVCSLRLAVAGFNELLHNAEGHGGLGGGAALGDDDAGYVTLCGQVHQLCQVFLGEVVAGEDHLGGVLALELLGEAVAEGLYHALGTQVAAADTDGNDQVYALFHPLVADGLVVVDLTLGNLAGKFLPTQEIVTGAVFVLENVEGVQGLGHVGLILGGIHKGLAAFNFYFDHMDLYLIILLTF